MANRRIPPGFIGLGVIALLAVGYMNRQHIPFVGGGSKQVEQSMPAQSLSQLSGIVPFRGLATYSGSTSFAGFRTAMDNYMIEKGLNVKYVNPTQEKASSSAGINMLVRGEVLFAQSSRSITPSEAGSNLEQIVVAHNPIGVVVNKNNPISNISLNELKAIYSGLSQGKYIAVSRGMDSGTTEFFTTSVLGSGQIWNDKLVGSTTEALQFVAKNPKAIYFGTYAEVNQRLVKLINVEGKSPLSSGYEPSSDLYIVYRKNNPNSVQAAQNYANLMTSGEGKAILIKSNYIPAE